MNRQFVFIISRILWANAFGMRWLPIIGLVISVCFIVSTSSIWTCKAGSSSPRGERISNFMVSVCPTSLKHSWRHGWIISHHAGWIEHCHMGHISGAEKAKAGNVKLKTAITLVNGRIIRQAENLIQHKHSDRRWHAVKTTSPHYPGWYVVCDGDRHPLSHGLECAI